jgi:hypothetical protein
MLPEMITVPAFRIVVNSALQLHHQAQGRTVELHDEAGQDVLAPEASSSISAEAWEIPPLRLGRSRVRTEFPSPCMPCDIPAT